MEAADSEELHIGSEDATGPLSSSELVEADDSYLPALLWRLVRMSGADFNVASSEPVRMWTGQITKVYTEKFPAPRASMKIGNGKVELGMRLEIYWQSENKWYPGRVVAFGKSGRRLAFQMEYEDGDDGGTGGWVTSSDQWRLLSLPSTRESTYNVEVYFRADKDVWCLPVSHIIKYVLEWSQMTLEELNLVKSRATAVPLLKELRARGGKPCARGIAQALYRILHPGEDLASITDADIELTCCKDDDVAPGWSEKTSTVADMDLESDTGCTARAEDEVVIRSIRLALAARGVGRTLAFRAEHRQRVPFEPVFLTVDESTAVEDSIRDHGCELSL